MNQTYDVAVIGAGISGAACSAALVAAGLSVVVIDKARGTGGRLSSKRLETAPGVSITLPLGCDSFSGHSNSFKRHIHSWLTQGVLKQVEETHDGDFWRGAPRSSSITRHLLAGSNLLVSHRVSLIQKSNQGWKIAFDSDEQSPIIANKVVLATPPQQAADLLPKGHPFKAALRNVKMNPQWVAIASVELVESDPSETGDTLSLSADGVVLDRVIVQKDEQSNSTLWIVMHANEEWSESHVEESKAAVLALLTDALKSRLAAVGLERLEVTPHHVHRWLYSTASATTSIQKGFWSEGALSSRERELFEGVVLCGDYFNPSSRKYGGVETAFLSGEAAAEYLICDMAPVLQLA